MNKESTPVEELASIVQIQKFSTDDGPGIRTTIFFKQCPLKCAWCQNPETISAKPSLQWFQGKCIGCESCVEACPNDAIYIDVNGVHIKREKCSACGACVEQCPSTALKLFGQKWHLDDLIMEIKKDLVFYERSGGGITASGGEPALQAGFVARLFNECKKIGISTALDTCGHVKQDALSRILPHADIILYDLKLIDSKKHEEYTGVSNDLILKNCKWLVKKAKALDKTIWIRTPLIPNYTATDDNVRSIARFIFSDLANNIDRWDLLAFNKLPAAKYERMGISWPLKDTPLLTSKQMNHFTEIAKEEGITMVKWSGMTRNE
ncbi:MAG: glycyl-radical enzyme activating protein [Promethearchaeota archaeon]